MLYSFVDVHFFFLFFSFFFLFFSATFVRAISLEPLLTETPNSVCCLVLRSNLLSNFIHPVYRLSRTPVSDETPFAGLSPAISTSHPYRQLSQPYRLFANDLLLRLLGRNLSLVAANDLLMRLLGRNLSLVASNLHLDTSLSRDLEDTKQSSSVLHGESFPPPFFTAWGFVTFEAFC